MNSKSPAQHCCTDAAAVRGALASPLRMEIAGLFGADAELSVSEMSRLTGRPATSLYHHLAVLEDAGILVDAGTRPKGKRFEKLYRAADSVVQVALDPQDAAARVQVTQTVASVFRMAGKDFEAALDRDDLCVEGPQRNIINFRVHMRASREFMSQLNERLQAIEELIGEHSATPCEPGPDDQFLSLTLALLPLRGRSASKTQSPTKD